uniref:F-box domain-containing protein n=1 Tax=Leersia perrieri TaxID=77586 RepID=A0A0D9V4P0_9ORYZ
MATEALEMGMGVGVRGYELKQLRQRHEDVVGREVVRGDGGVPSLANAAVMDLHGDVLESVVERVPAADLAATARVSREWLRAEDACVVALKAPGVWRVDPVFAAVGDRVIALGGACKLALADGEDASAVEVHESGSWTPCGPMPAALRESAAATWLSTAATDHRVYLIDRTTGWASWFDPANQQWGPTCRLRPDAAVSTWGLAPGRAGAERLVLFGAKRGAEPALKGRVVIHAWEVDGDSLALSSGAAHETITMPSEMSDMLFPHDEDEVETAPSIGVCGNAAGGYVYNAANPAIGAVLYELRDGEGTAVVRWEWVACTPAVQAEPLGRVMLACSPVVLDELARGTPAELLTAVTRSKAS